MSAPSGEVSLLDEKGEFGGAFDLTGWSSRVWLPKGVPDRKADAAHILAAVAMSSWSNEALAQKLDACN